MATGDLWRMPDGRDALELRASGRLLLVAPIVAGWPWPAPPVVAVRGQCTLQPSRYLHGQVPIDVLGDGAHAAAV